MRLLPNFLISGFFSVSTASMGKWVAVTEGFFRGSSFLLSSLLDFVGGVVFRSLAMDSGLGLGGVFFPLLITGVAC